MQLEREKKTHPPDFHEHFTKQALFIHKTLSVDSTFFFHSLARSFCISTEWHIALVLQLSPPTHRKANSLIFRRNIFATFGPHFKFKDFSSWNIFLHHVKVQQKTIFTHTNFSFTFYKKIYMSALIGKTIHVLTRNIFFLKVSFKSFHIFFGSTFFFSLKEFSQEIALT